MYLTPFVSELFSSGQLRVPNPACQIAVTDLQTALELVQARAARVALDYPGSAPAVNAAVCEWALVQFFRASQALVYRDIGEETLRAGLALPCPAAPFESRHYSADLIFVFLPELAKLARVTSPNDPLVEILQRWSSAWPLSSVGMKLTSPVDHTEFRTAPRLWQYYLERIHQRGDTARAALDDVREGLTSLWGSHAKHFSKSI